MLLFSVLLVSRRPDVISISSLRGRNRESAIGVLLARETSRVISYVPFIHLFDIFYPEHSAKSDFDELFRASVGIMPARNIDILKPTSSTTEKKQKSTLRRCACIGKKHE